MISLIVARAHDNAIGRDGDMPWHIPEDLRAFQRETSGGAVIMGRNTWDSLPAAFRPLKGRFNCVVSRRTDFEADHIGASLADAVAACRDAGHMRIYGMGGARIYRELLPYAHRLLITDIDLAVSDADTFFPAFDEADWTEAKPFKLRAADPSCVMREFVRENPPMCF
ncbi:MAG: dihydrofolate reductase [Litoreibacter sp.]